MADLFDGVGDYPVSAFGDTTYQDSVFRTWSAGNMTADPTNAQHLAVSWSDMRNSTLTSTDPYATKTNSDVGVAESFDGGRTWTTKIFTVPNDQFFPWAAFDRSGKLRVGYMDRSYDAANHKYGFTLATETSPGSLTFTTQQVTNVLSDPTRDDRWFSGTTINPAFPHPTSFIGDYNGIAAGPNGIATLWTDLRAQVTFGGRSGSGSNSEYALVRRHAPADGRRSGRRPSVHSSADMADMVDTNSFKNGMHIELDGKVWRILEFQHVKPGKGGAFVRTKLRSLVAGAVVDKTFRAGEKFPRVHTEVKNVQFLYEDGTEAHFMDPDTYDQFAVPRGEIEDELTFMQPNATVQVLAVNGKPSSVQLPASVELSVVETEPGVKGDTVSNVTKPATLETGAVVQVPLFVNVGDRLKVDPKEKRYISRV